MSPRKFRRGPKSDQPSTDDAPRPARDWSALFPTGELRFATFIFRLPWQLPINSGSSFSFLLEGKLDDRWDFASPIKAVEGKGDFVDATTGEPLIQNFHAPFVSIRIWQVRHKDDLRHLVDPLTSVARHVYGGGQPPKPKAKPAEEAYETVIETVTQAGAADTEAGAPDVASAAFERCLRALNRLLLSYGLGLRDEDFEFASPRTLDLFAMLATRPLDGPYDKGPVLYLLPALRLPYAKPFLNPEAMQRLTRFMVAVTLGNPFLQPARFGLLAQRAHRAGDNAGVLVAIASAGELLLNTTLKLLLVEDGELERYDALLIEEPGLAARVRKHYAPRLGGNWNMEDIRAVVGQWWNRVQVPRGRVLHGGQWPTHGEADEAIASGKELERFIGDRLTAKHKRYPKTALSQVGREGLRRRGLSDKNVGVLVATHDKQLDAFWKAAGGVVDVRQPD